MYKVIHDVVGKDKKTSFAAGDELPAKYPREELQRLIDLGAVIEVAKPEADEPEKEVK